MDWNTWTPRERATLCFIKRNGKVLLIHKKRGLGAGKINGPGGRMEPGETPLECAIRETQEEICVTPRDLEKQGELHFQFLDGYSLFCTVYVAHGYYGEPRETEEAVPFWADIGEIPYEGMWEDDPHWLPLAITGRNFRGYFEFDGERLLSHRVDDVAAWKEHTLALIAGCGFLGAAVAEELIARDWNGSDIHGVTRYPAGVAALAATRIQATACDISNAEEVRQRLQNFRGVDVLVHSASSRGGGPNDYRKIYLDGARNLLDILQPRTFLFTSSTSVYAQNDGSWVTEESPAEPARDTGRILRETEELVLSRGGIVARLSGIYGPGRWALLRKFLEGTAAIEDGGGRWVNQIHRDDAAAAIAFLLNNHCAPGIYNISDGSPLTQLDCHKILADHFHKPLPPAGSADPNRKRGVTSKRIDTAKLRAAGWRPRFASMRDALAMGAGEPYGKSVGDEPAP